MKKILLALTAVAAMTASASGADLGARPYAKAPALAPTPIMNWTGFYVFGGGGGGLWSADSNVVNANGSLTRDQRLGGNGWFGTVGAGYDWQFNDKWVLGIFGDGQFGDIRGSLNDSATFVGAVEGREKLQTSYAAGARLGYLVAPNVLSYVNAGYSGSEWSGSNLSLLSPPYTAASSTPSFNRSGWFIGGGVENNLDFFGIAAPGWFMKTEYRSAYYDRVTLPESNANGLTGTAVTFKPQVQTISTSLVYRFNRSGPVVSKY